MNKYDELMQRHARISARWMEEVGKAKARGLDHTQFNSAGIVLRKDGTLWMQARENGKVVFELLTKEGDIGITVLEY
jgi:hypothetical protein